MLNLHKRDEFALAHPPIMCNQSPTEVFHIMVTLNPSGIDEEISEECPLNKTRIDIRLIPFSSINEKC